MDTKKDTKDTMVAMIIKGTNHYLENFRNLKSRVGFGKWTFLKMSKMRNLKSFLKIQNNFNPSDENALKIFTKF